MQGLFNGKLVLARVLEHLFPSSCPVCKRKSSDRAFPFCPECWSEIRPYKGNRCSVCSIPLPHSSSICGDCIEDKPYFKTSVIYGLYDGVLKEAIAQLKYSGMRSLAKPLSELLLELPLPEADLIVPVPPDRLRLKTRGFNHTSILAKEVSRRLSLPLELNALVKIKSTPRQSNLKRQERLKNLRRAFRAEKDLSGKKVILVDDVITTGTTASECARALLRAGAVEVSLLAIARSAGDRVQNVDFFSSEKVI